jgi:hypothetical protein
MAEQEKKQFVSRKAFAIPGPAIIALGGEWLIGPPKFVKYSLVFSGLQHFCASSGFS